MGITRLLAVLCAGAAVALASGGAAAQAWPSKPIRIIVPFTPGSGTDIIARALSDRLSANLGQPVVVENRAGAGGTIGAAAVAKADPDGYTILVQSSSHTVNPFTFQSLPYDTQKDFAGVTPLAVLPNVLIISPAKGIRSVQELVAAAKAKPGTINYASAGSGSATHLNAEKFRLNAGFDAVHIPFKGSPEAITEVMTGRVDYYFSPVVSALPQIKDGKLLALAVGSPTRSSVLPDVPTTVEAGVPNSEYTFWVGMLVPAKTPRDVVKKLHDEVQKALASPEVKERYAKLGAEPMPMTPEQFDAYIRDEMAANEKLIRAAGIKAN
ncbi:MAG: tripartite tricarboxylate transporter substrate binding protein [Burkholderiales bacterium]|nr:tripartite tricarboxylate transporter substrate binding protein [Burkholderiales bacterium]